MPKSASRDSEQGESQRRGKSVQELLTEPALPRVALPEKRGSQRKRWRLVQNQPYLSWAPRQDSSESKTGFPPVSRPECESDVDAKTPFVAIQEDPGEARLETIVH